MSNLFSLKAALEQLERKPPSVRRVASESGRTEALDYDQLSTEWGSEGLMSKRGELSPTS